MVAVGKENLAKIEDETGVKPIDYAGFRITRLLDNAVNKAYRKPKEFVESENFNNSRKLHHSLQSQVRDDLEEATDPTLEDENSDYYYSTDEAEAPRQPSTFALEDFLK